MQISRRSLLACLTVAALLPLSALTGQDNPAQTKAREALEQAMKASPATNPPAQPPVVAPQPKAPESPASPKALTPEEALHQKMSERPAQPPATPARSKPGAPPPKPADKARPSTKEPVWPDYQPLPSPSGAAPENLEKARETLRQKMSDTGARANAPLTPAAPQMAPSTEGPDQKKLEAAAKEAAARQAAAKAALAKEAEAKRKAAIEAATKEAAAKEAAAKEAAARAANARRAAAIEAAAKQGAAKEAAAKEAAARRAAAGEAAAKEAQAKQAAAIEAKTKRVTTETPTAGSKEGTIPIPAKKEKQMVATGKPSAKKETATAQKAPVKPAEREKPKAIKSLDNLAPLEGPPPPLPAAKLQRLEQLLQQYKADRISPDEYHSQRAKILAEP